MDPYSYKPNMVAGVSIHIPEGDWISCVHCHHPHSGHPNDLKCIAPGCDCVGYSGGYNFRVDRGAVLDVLHRMDFDAVPDGVFLSKHRIAFIIQERVALTITYGAFRQTTRMEKKDAVGVWSNKTDALLLLSLFAKQHGAECVYFVGGEPEIWFIGTLPTGRRQHGTE